MSLKIKKHKILIIVLGIILGLILLGSFALYIAWDFMDITYPLFWKPAEPTEINIEQGEVVLSISTPQQLVEFRDNVNNKNTFEGKTVILNSDIDMREYDGVFEPIGGKGHDCYYDQELKNSFKGTFDGRGHTIKNLLVQDNDTNEKSIYNCCGLFGIINNSCIKNLNLSSSVIEGTNKIIGGIVGSSQYSIVENCSFNSKLIGYNSREHKDIMGGIVGYNMDSLIKNCYSAGVIDCKVDGDVNNICHSDSRVGGIVGINYSKQYKGVVRNCYNKSEIIAKGEKIKKNDAMRIGGIAGENYYMVENCYNVGTFKTEHPYAGIVSDNGWATDKGNLGGGIHPIRVGPQPYIRNCYYLNTTSNKGLVKNTKDSPEPIALTEEQMKSIDFLNKLNSQSTKALMGNIYWSIGEDKNGGYPYLIDNN